MNLSGIIIPPLLGREDISEGSALFSSAVPLTGSRITIIIFSPVAIFYYDSYGNAIILAEPQQLTLEPPEPTRQVVSINTKTVAIRPP